MADISLNLDTKKGTEIDLDLSIGGSGTANYNRLFNKPSFNGVQLIGDMTPFDVKYMSEDTAEGWSSKPNYIPKVGEIVIYRGEDSIDLKVGDGVVPVVDLPFVCEHKISAVVEALNQHIGDHVVHVTQENKDFWNNKLNYDLAGEELILTKN